MSYMFYFCSLLKELNLSNFNMNNIIDMRHMFYGSKSLKYLNISNFKINHVTNMIKILFKYLLIEEININFIRHFYIIQLYFNYKISFNIV